MAAVERNSAGIPQSTRFVREQAEAGIALRFLPAYGLKPFHPRNRQGSFVNKATSAQSVHIRIVVVTPPPGVQFAVQRGRSALLAPSAASHEQIRFELSLRVGPPRPGESVNFVGEFAQGPPADRFIYLNSGTLAGQADSCWTRRAKLKLASIPQPMVETALATPELILQARVAGTLRDGGPICASVKAQDIVWSVVRDAATG